MEIPLIELGTIIGAGLAGLIGGKRGSKRGAEDSLNGTANTVKRIERTLNEHVTLTATEFKGVNRRLDDQGQRLSYIEGKMSE